MESKDGIMLEDTGTFTLKHQRCYWVDIKLIYYIGKILQPKRLAICMEKVFKKKN